MKTLTHLLFIFPFQKIIMAKIILSFLLIVRKNYWLVMENKNERIICLNVKFLIVKKPNVME